MQNWLTIAVQCHNFQRRLSWMAASLLPQARGIVLMVDAMANQGDPTTEFVAEYYGRAGIDFRLKDWWNLREFERRGIVRNAQVERCNTEWILFADSDMVYAPGFFEKLKAELDPSFNGMYISGRYSQANHEATDTMVNAAKNEFPVFHPFERAATLELVGRSCVGAGFFQLIRREACGGYYVKPDECADWRWSERGQKAKSDQQFRHRIGSKKRLPKWFWHNQIHLNHARDNQAGCHLEEQR